MYWLSLHLLLYVPDLWRGEVDGDHVRPVLPDGLYFGGCGVVRHNDGTGDACLGTRPGQALTMVTTGVPYL